MRPNTEGSPRQDAKKSGEGGSLRASRKAALLG